MISGWFLDIVCEHFGVNWFETVAQRHVVGCDWDEQAFNNIVKRMLEAKGRGMWDADEDTVQRLQEMFAKSDAQLEGV